MFDDPIINLKGFLHSGITEFVIPSCDLFLTDLGVAAREGTTGVASDVKERNQVKQNNVWKNQEKCSKLKKSLKREKYCIHEKRTR